MQRCQEGLENKMRGKWCFYYSIDLLYYKFQRISLNWGGSFINSPKWSKKKNTIINPKHNDYKCLQYVLTVALNYQKIEKDPQRISKMKNFIDQYNWKETKFH